MQVDLIITTYNRPDALEAVLCSVRIQTVLPDQIIVADDGSTAETTALIQKYQPVFGPRLVHAWHEDKGFRVSEIRNKALALVSAKYIILIDGDMVLNKHFVEDHIRHAREGYFLQGGRVMMTEEKTKEILKEPTKDFPRSIFDQGIESRLEKRLTAFRSPLIALLTKKELKNRNKVRTCNMSFFMEDVKRINGFNNAFIGWGREDSEFIERLTNTGIKGLIIKFVALAYHLYHKEEPRASLDRNDKLLRAAVNNKSVYCEDGLSKFLTNKQ